MEKALLFVAVVIVLVLAYRFGRDLLALLALWIKGGNDTGSEYQISDDDVYGSGDYNDVYEHIEYLDLCGSKYVREYLVKYYDIPRSHAKDLRAAVRYICEEHNIDSYEEFIASSKLCFARFLSPAQQQLLIRYSDRANIADAEENTRVIKRMADRYGATVDADFIAHNICLFRFTDAAAKSPTSAKLAKLRGDVIQIDEMALRPVLKNYPKSYQKVIEKEVLGPRIVVDPYLVSHYLNGEKDKMREEKDKLGFQLANAERREEEAKRKLVQEEAERREFNAKLENDPELLKVGEALGMSLEDMYKQYREERKIHGGDDEYDIFRRKLMDKFYIGRRTTAV